MSFSRRHLRSTLRAVIPLLTLVWASLPLHRCNLASASPVEARVADVAAAVDRGSDRLMVDCGHQAPDSSHPAKTTISCNDLGRAGPDLRPVITIDSGLVQVSFDSRWFDRAQHPASQRGLARPLDVGRWRLRPLHLQKSALLV